jgi:predicted HAD superfamily Cof-like phosphohydrolase
MQEDVADFHRATNTPVEHSPTQVRADRVKLRWSLIAEEAEEIRRALTSDHLEGIADGIADLVYVTLGLAVECGIDIAPVWDLVHAANMQKVGGPVREDGKILKPEGWQPPDIAGEVMRQWKKR